MIKVKFLGTTASIPTRERNLPSVFVMFKGERMLFDCGEGTQRQLMDQSLKFMKINRIFITHWHADHFAGILGLIQTMSLEGRKEPLYVYGPKRTSEFLEQLLTIGYFGRNFKIEVTEMDDCFSIEGNGYTVTAFQVTHRIPSLGYVLEEAPRTRANMEKAKKYGLDTGPEIGKLKAGKTITFKGKTIKPEDIIEHLPGRKIVYTGDTKYDENTIKHAKGADLLIHDSTFASNKEDIDEIGHSTAKEAATVAKKANVKLLVLTHISRRYQEGKGNTDPKILLEEAKKVFDNTILAHDFLEFEVK
ncbi:MAG: ribonuclease Z [Candidatus Aenigmarchaeota archaeon]|nr:ribonuclease Z [Candidatus Aenigmarchaeota archaeon]MCK5451927.1 ribonuclease Z [Candidatus Aenigmarchaeota archaeon]